MGGAQGGGRGGDKTIRGKEMGAGDGVKGWTYSGFVFRFNTKTYITPHICDFCKKTVMMGVRCKDCK